MRRLSNVFFFLFFLLMIPVMSFASTYTFSDDFDTGIDGWTGKIGTWTNPANTLQSSSNVYSVIWKDGSNQGGLYQSITVDAYFDFDSDDSYHRNRYAHLRLRMGENNTGTNPFWDTGYLAQFGENAVSVQNTYLWGNPVIGQTTFSNSPFTSTGWYTLRFDVSGRGANTNLKLWIQDTLYLDVDYNDSTGNNDNGYIGLGRLIKYDNASGYSSDTSPSPVPEPATMILFSIGLLGLSRAGRRKTQHTIYR